MTSKAHDEASRFIHTLTQASGNTTRMFLVREDFTSMIMDIIHTHPGLNFLVENPLFHARYVEVVRFFQSLKIPIFYLKIF